MNWLNTIVKEIVDRFPEGDLLIQSGASPSGTYHMGSLREVITSDAVVLELAKRGRKVKHVHFVDDLDALRKIPVDVPANYDKYLGMPLCDVPAPDNSGMSLSEYFLKDLTEVMDYLGIEVDVIRSHEKYRSGFFAPAIEMSLDHIKEIKNSLETISQRKLDANWSPIQVMEEGRLKNRKFLGIDKKDKTVSYSDNNGTAKSVKYDDGKVKLDWRLDWPARWWLLKVDAEPFGRDHATKGGSYETGVSIMKYVYDAKPPIPIPYDFVNRAGDPKKMSASQGTGIAAKDIAKVLPPEVLRFFILRFPPDKRLYFDPVDGVTRLIDEYAELAAKTDKSEDEKELLYVCTRGLNKQTVSRVPFSHLVASYQAALKNPDKTLEILSRTEYKEIAKDDADTIKNELKFIDEWLRKWAPDDSKFELISEVDTEQFTNKEKEFLTKFADDVEKAPLDADGAWFHSAIYRYKDELGIEPGELFKILYKVLIGKDSGPRAGWFMSILPRDWLILRLRLEEK